MKKVLTILECEGTIMLAFGNGYGIALLLLLLFV